MKVTELGKGKVIIKVIKALKRESESPELEKPS